MIETPLNPEHLAVVKKGAEAIAEWRQANPGVRLELAQAKLGGAKLAGANLEEADLEEANLNNADLNDAKFNDAFLLGAELNGADLRGADLSDADLSNADLSGAQLNGADLSDANLSDAELDGADFNRTVLMGANLNGAKLDMATFSGTNLQYSKSAEFDGNDLSTGQLHRATYPWLTLRRAYSGPMVTLHAMLLLLFFSPFVARGALHLANTKAVHVGQAVADELVKRVPGEPAVDLVEKMGLEDSSLISVLLQWDRSPLLTILVALLLAYAALRFVLVWRVAPMREEEDRTNHTPPLSGYIGLMWWHKAARVLFLVSIASTAWHVGDWLMEPVLVGR